MLSISQIRKYAFIVFSVVLFLLIFGYTFSKSRKSKSIIENSSNHGIKYSIIDKNHILNQKNALEYHILTNTPEKNLTKSKIIKFINYMENKNQSTQLMIIYGYLSRIAYEESIKYQHSKSYKHNFIFMYVKSSINNQKGTIYWLQLKGKLSHLYGEKTLLNIK